MFDLFNLGKKSKKKIKLNIKKDTLGKIKKVVEIQNLNLHILLMIIKLNY